MPTAHSLTSLQNLQGQALYGIQDEDTPTAAMNVPSLGNQQASEIYNISGQKVGNSHKVQ